jgi:hypothetical protein
MMTNGTKSALGVPIKAGEWTKFTGSDSIRDAEGVAAVKVDRLVVQRGEPREVRRVHLSSLTHESGNGAVRVAGVPALQTRPRAPSCCSWPVR